MHLTNLKIVSLVDKLYINESVSCRGGNFLPNPTVKRITQNFYRMN